MVGMHLLQWVQSDLAWGSAVSIVSFRVIPPSRMSGGLA